MWRIMWTPPKIILLINFIFDPTFLPIASYQILKNYAILINHESFFQRKDFPQLHRFWFFEINSLMAETFKKTFSKTTFLQKKLLHLIIINLFSKIGNSWVVGNLFLEKVICTLKTEAKPRFLLVGAGIRNKFKIKCNHIITAKKKLKIKKNF